MWHERQEDEIVPFTLRERRRVDRLERSVSGYTDEGGVFVPGLLQNTADAVSAIKGYRAIAVRVQIALWSLVGLAVINSLHLYGISDLFKLWFGK